MLHKPKSTNLIWGCLWRYGSENIRRDGSEVSASTGAECRRGKFVIGVDAIASPRPPPSQGLEVVNVIYDGTQRDWLCVLRTGVEGEENQEIFINEPPHEWNEVHFRHFLDFLRSFPSLPFLPLSPSLPSVSLERGPQVRHPWVQSVLHRDGGLLFLSAESSYLPSG